MKKTLLLLSACSLIGGCALAPQTTSFKGTVTDATMNTVAIADQDGNEYFFSTLNADRSEVNGLLVGSPLEVVINGNYTPGKEAEKIVSLSPLMGGDRDDHGCIASAGYTWSEVQQSCVRLFEKGIRTTAVDGSNRSIYVLFSPDSLKAELFSSDSEKSEILLRRTLPSKEYVWNVEDDDTKNLRYQDGCWTISQRGKLIYQQQKVDTDSALGPFEELHYEGVLPAASCCGIKYQLSIKHRAHSGDGTFHLLMTYLEAENGKDVTFTFAGNRNTQRGTPFDKDATVWQLIDNDKKEIFNFLYVDENTLTLLNDQFEKSRTKLNYSLKRTN